MHMPGLIPLLIVLVLAFLLFSKPGRISGLMEDLGKGIKGFRKGLGDEQNSANAAAEEPRQVPDQNAQPRETDRAQN
ncbi:twin-arginine translocase TatA/TatE family subunit [Terricaulis sp.]|uniref:twin-arginine translocase TatA/TatE family subunit n=1 Tax=Terricaulis sp. TaxID=2768686 RepID=UPI002AC71BE4|nr:twin-arginine translocase TatA/TatE family subunit [Terricaulis sp.]MDZ4693062.1 twin-arginine translocase TatA/TatE family subunit [Terricaulis sp.]